MKTKMPIIRPIELNQNLITNPKIKYVDHGIANNFGETIEINVHLKEYPKLHNSILRHELDHTTKEVSWKDLKLDITENRTSSWEMLKFILKYPRSFSQFVPLYWSKEKGLVYDINLIFIYFVITFIIVGGIYLGKII